MIINFLQAYDLICLAIIAELFLGRILNLINVTGDIVMAAIEDVRAGKQTEP